MLPGMSLRLVQQGYGPRRVFVLAFFVANRAALLASLPPSACVVTDVDNPGGRFARRAGEGGVDLLEDAIAWARKRAGFEEVSFLILVGWSAGCQAVRELLRAGAKPDAVLALDGISGSVPPREDQLEPWRRLAARASAGECCAVIAHTAMTYMERRPAATRYASTTTTAGLIAGTIGEAPPVVGEVPALEGSLYVLAYPSADIDGDAHRRQQNLVMPDLLRRVVMPWLEEHGLEVPEAPPVTVRSGTARPPPSPVLRRGSRGEDVTAWQELLRARGYPVALDGDFGLATDAATRALQRAARLTIDGVVGPSTRAAAASFTATPSRQTSPGPGPAPFPALTEAAKDSLFGVVAWVPVPGSSGDVKVTNGYQRNLVGVDVPELVGLLGAPPKGRVLMHKLVAPKLVELFAAWTEAGLIDRVKAWSGGLAFRRVRGGSALSSHARGIAFDINAPGLPLGKKDPGAGKPWSVAELVPIARDLGWFWGNDFSRPDPHHFEVGRL